MVKKYLTLFSLWMNLLLGFTPQQLNNPSVRRPNPPFITGDAFRAYCDFVLDETNDFLNPEAIQDCSTIFVGPYVLAHFFEQYHPRIRGSYILVTHNTDDDAPGPHAKYLEEEKLIAWFAQNVEGFTHPKLIPIPIGLGNRYTPHADLTTLRALANEPEPAFRNILAYLCMEKTNRAERSYVLSLFDRANFVTYYHSRPYHCYLADLKHSKFAFTPRAAGQDCHRTWEALYLGAIPILRTSSSDEMYRDLPVLIVQKWTDITREFLTQSYAEIQSKPKNLYKLNVQYWLDLIESSKRLGVAPQKEGF